MKEIRLGIGFATGRRSFRKVLTAYINLWKASESRLPRDEKVSLHLFVSYDVGYHRTQSTDYTNLNQEIVDAFDSITFLGAKNPPDGIERLQTGGQFSRTELESVFGSGYAGKRNAILYAAVCKRMDALLFLDDDEYPMAVTNNRDLCLWSGQEVFFDHLREIGRADYTFGHHCGYISPIPQLQFGEALDESDFQRFIEAISNDIVSWSSIRRLMETGGVTYASTEILQKNESEEVPLVNGCKFISGSNLCLNLRDPQRSLPFFNPPGARGEDTFLSTLLKERSVLMIPCYTFHDGFSIYQHLLEGALPVRLSAIDVGTRAVNTRFLNACIGWIRYKPLLVRLTAPDRYDKEMRSIGASLEATLPKVANYFGDRRYLGILTEFSRYSGEVEKHREQFLLTQQTWKKLMDELSAG